MKALAIIFSVFFFSFIAYNLGREDEKKQSTAPSQIENNDEKTSMPVEEEVVESEPEPEICDHCYGSGKCGVCGVTGRITCYRHDTNRDGYCTDCDNRGYKTCYECGGKGYCTWCRGRGTY